MAFVDRYIGSLNSSNLMDDKHHSATEALAASALADVSIDGIGSLLCRVKYADGSTHKLFESGSANLAQLLRIWTKAVTEKGRSRGWIKANTAWDMQAAMALYDSVAAKSLAYWMTGKPITCSGGFELQKIKDMISELECLMQSHNARANGKMRVMQ